MIYKKITQKTKDRATRTSLKTGSAPEELQVPTPHMTVDVLLLNDTDIFRYKTVI